MPAIRFASAARDLGAAARAAGLAVPSFRSPPRLSGARRTIRRLPGGAVVSVRLRGRRYEELLTDMIDGVLVANRVSGPAAGRLRHALWRAAAEPEVDLIAAERAERPPPGPRPRGTVVDSPPSLPFEARVAERQTQAA